MRHFKQFWLVAIATLTSAVAYLLINAEPLYAANGGNAGSGEVGGCSTTGHYCTSWGIVWVKQPLDVFLGSSNIVGLTEQQKNEMRANCAGMIDPYVIRQAYVRFDDGGTTQTDSVAGLIDNDTANRNNAVYVNPATITGGISAATAYGMFQYALSIGVPMTYDWGGTAIFAYDNSWDCPPDDPTCGPVTPDPDSSDGYFRAKSSVQVDAVNSDHVPAISVQESDYDGSVYVTFATDGDTAKVKFGHTLYYTNQSVNWTEHGHGHDIVNDPTTSWTVTNNSGGGSGSYTPDARISTGSTVQDSVYAVTEVTVSVPVGQTVTACSRIEYGKNVDFTSTTTTAVSDDPRTPQDESHEAYDTWTPDDPTGTGYSTACAVITHPSDPGGTVQAGNNASNLMFAGETSTVGWDVSGSHYDTRRLSGYRAVVFNYNSVLNYDASLVSANVRTGSDPCSYYGRSTRCQVMDNIESNNWNQSHSMNDTRSIAVPNEVGWKYCNSFGYYYESYYGTRLGDSGSFSWTPTGYNYWYDFNASCRTIAKKPTVAIWNSSILTAGGIATSSSPRFDSPTLMGLTAGAGGSKTLYGAWVEHLAAIGRNVTYFGSGSSFAIGSKNLAAPKSNPLTLDNSTLTISNNGRLGSSGIFNNSTYRTRLTTFLENQATRPGGSELGAMSNVSDTRILRYDGNLKITGNITTAPGPYNSIYHVPQVVIFVHGDLEIASDVTRIDAWLIVDGKINTCSEFQSGLTEADAISRLRDTCNKQLVFNGPVLANNLVLTRSFGADPLITRTGTFGTASTRQAAGEVFNLRADTYLWAYAQAGRYDSSYTESYTRELAPRY